MEGKKSAAENLIKPLDGKSHRKKISSPEDKIGEALEDDEIEPDRRSRLQVGVTPILTGTI